MHLLSPSAPSREATAPLRHWLNWRQLAKAFSLSLSLFLESQRAWEWVWHVGLVPPASPSAEDVLLAASAEPPFCSCGTSSLPTSPRPEGVLYEPYFRKRDTTVVGEENQGSRAQAFSSDCACFGNGLKASVPIFSLPFCQSLCLSEVPNPTGKSERATGGSRPFSLTVVSLNVIFFPSQGKLDIVTDILGMRSVRIVFPKNVLVCSRDTAGQKDKRHQCGSPGTWVPPVLAFFTQMWRQHFLSGCSHLYGPS